MAHIDFTALDLVLTDAGDLVAVDNPVLEELGLRLLTERGSAWWDLSFGSRLHELATTKAGADLERRVQEEVRAALRPMLTAGALSSLQVTVTRVDRSRVDLEVRAVDSRRRPITFATTVRM